MPTKPSYARHLPRQVPDGFPIFLTWNFKGSMPRQAIERLKHERERLENEPPRASETAIQKKIRENVHLFALADGYLDQARDGPSYLEDPAAARIVEDVILAGSADRYDLFAWCIMPNHVHVLLTPRLELKDVTQRIKGSTSFKINGVHQARGRVFWQDESYDHWVRDEDDMMRVIDYIESNPVSARLRERPDQWPW
jgi:putative transposase